MSEYWLDAETWNHNPQLGSVLNQRFKGQKFDSYFGKNSHHTQNHALKIYLRIHLEPVWKFGKGQPKQLNCFCDEKKNLSDRPVR
jgi:hypothetical protein